MLKLFLLSIFSFVLVFAACQDETSESTHDCESGSEELDAGATAGEEPVSAGQVQMQLLDFTDMDVNQDPAGGSQDME